MEQYKCAKARVADVVRLLEELKYEASESGLKIVTASIGMSITALSIADLKHVPTWNDSNVEKE
jgi:hypothetical protein